MIELPNDELLARLDERVATLIQGQLDLKESIIDLRKDYWERIGACPMGITAHADLEGRVDCVEGEVKTIRDENAELRGGRRVAYIIAGAGITIVGMIIGYFI